MDLSAGSLQHLIVHYVGNKNSADPLHVSGSVLDLGEEMKEALGQSFLNRFRNNQEIYFFSHASSLQYHEVFNYCKDKNTV